MTKKLLTGCKASKQKMIKQTAFVVNGGKNGKGVKMKQDVISTTKMYIRARLASLKHCFVLKKKKSI